MYKAIIIEDEYLLANVIENYLHKIDEIELLEKFEDAISAIAFLKTNTVDLIFLDIQMSPLSGMEFAKIIKNDTKIIFTTAYSEYALEGFEINALDYLLKPIKFDRFLKSVNRFFEFKKLGQTRPQKHIIVKSNGELHKIILKDLIYIESLQEYLRYYTINNKYIVYGSLIKVSEELAEAGFIRIHKSYVVSLSKILSIQGSNVSLQKDIQLPIGRTFKSDLIANFNT